MRKLLICAALLVFASAGSVWAETVGVPVGAIGSATPVGNVSANGTINFYIPLKQASSGTYGVNGVGLSPDTCVYPLTCGNGQLRMYLRFSPVQTGDNLLTLSFTDLDLFGSNVNDPDFFLESIGVYYASGTQIAFVDEASDAEVVSANDSTQVLQLLVNIASDPFYIKLNFKSNFTNDTDWAKYANTPEALRATVGRKAVPEPMTLSLLGLGLIAAVGLAGGRGKNV
jgi:hypothetical protein